MSRLHQEIEIKHPIRNPGDVIASLERLGARQIADREEQDDVYFVPAHKNFLEGDIVSEWFRLRSTPGKHSVNFKRWLPLGAQIQTHCDEYETSVGDVNTFALILGALDFKEIVRVSKRRSTWELENIEVAIDEVAGLGAFIELEAKSVDGTVEQVQAQLEQMLRTLNADALPRDRRGYPYQLLGREK